MKRKISPIYLDNEIEKEIPVIVRKRGLIAFGYYGGKYSHLDWLLPLLPKSHHYCEPFAGSAAVLINREVSPIETYNDIDGDVVNFFRVLRDNKEEIINKISLTPFSREEYFNAIYGEDKNISDIERARRFYILARQTRLGMSQTSTLGRWANCKNTSRNNMSGSVSRWINGTSDLFHIANRLCRVQIENRPAIDIIGVYDSKDTLFYCDPPYLHETRGDTKSYFYEMSSSDYQEFSAVVNKCVGKVAVSGYDNPIMEELFPKSKWTKILGPIKIAHSNKKNRQEVLWINY